VSFQIPTTAELAETIIAQLEAAFGQTIPVYVKAALRVLGKTWAGVLIVLYKYGGSVFLQQFVQYASTEQVIVNGRQLIPLVEWGRLVGVGDPDAATRAEYTIEITVTNQTGSIPANTALFNADNKVTYLTLSAVTLDAATVTANIRASSDQDDGGGRGAVGNMSIGDTVSFVTPPANVLSTAEVTVELITGADGESWDAYRVRVVDRFRKQPQGGAYADYEFWAEGLEGIINAYPYTGDPGIVNVYSEATPESSGDPDGIPTAAQLLAVSEAIELDDNGLASRRPANAFVNSLAITRTAFDVVVDGLTGYEASDYADLVTAIQDTVERYLLGREPFIAGLTLGKRRDRVVDAELSGVVMDTCVGFNAVFTELTVSTGGGSNFYIYPLGEGEKAKLGTLTVEVTEVEIYVYVDWSPGGSESAIRTAVANYINGLGPGTDVTIAGVEAAAETITGPGNVTQIYLSFTGPPSVFLPTLDLEINEDESAVTFATSDYIGVSSGS
jgi:uncharacterized phage protein gp47/JayE